MFSEDVNFKLLKEYFVVLIFAYNLTFLKTSVTCSHWDTKWLLYIYVCVCINPPKVFAHFSEVLWARVSLSMDSEWKLQCPSFRALDWMWFARESTMASALGGPDVLVSPEMTTDIGAEMLYLQCDLSGHLKTVCQRIFTSWSGTHLNGEGQTAVRTGSFSLLGL